MGSKNAPDSPASAEPSLPSPVLIRRVRHEARRRTLTIAEVENLTPTMRRVRFQSPDLADFTSLSPDDHLKIFVLQPGQTFIGRDYTPRSFDHTAGTLVIDFALHDAGPATAWARSARAGDTLEIGGPRGSAIVADVFSWYLLVGDETALPAIGRRVEELRSGVSVTTIIMVDTAHDIQRFQTSARWTAEWVCRDVHGIDDIVNADRAIDRLIPKVGNGFVWIAGEAEFAKSLRAHLLERHNHPINHMKAAGYWVRGAAGARQPLD